MLLFVHRLLLLPLSLFLCVRLLCCYAELLAGIERAGCLTLVVFLMLYGCHCYLPLPHNSVRVVVIYAIFSDIDEKPINLLKSTICVYSTMNHSQCDGMVAHTKNERRQRLGIDTIKYHT